ncbi:hypothetical protein SAMN04487948_102196 [Halogranum amylolyticum]|uniref:ABC transporter permease n=1 Tax=Halogranum amylolyticum TaxID=660520 RepID=A0A1H8PAT3_9EURY|nr:hypothetical protein [Halogranum amylolyticum]SEO39099.1 hypothetical protein SAMN04487948_102196 [Halogranum amylolyticum]
MSLRETLDHDSWWTVAGTGAGYGLILLVLFAVLFVLPFLVFYALP